MKEIGLSIIDPWEFGTDEPVLATVVERNAKTYLIRLKDPLIINDAKISYLISEFRDKNIDDSTVLQQSGRYLMNMVYSEKINMSNFRGFKVSDFRGGFLTGEIIIR